MQRNCVQRVLFSLKKYVTWFYCGLYTEDYSKEITMGRHKLHEEIVKVCRNIRQTKHSIGFTLQHLKEVSALQCSSSNHNRSSIEEVRQIRSRLFSYQHMLVIYKKTLKEHWRNRRRYDVVKD